MVVNVIPDINMRFVNVAVMYVSSSAYSKTGRHELRYVNPTSPSDNFYRSKITVAGDSSKENPTSPSDNFYRSKITVVGDSSKEERESTGMIYRDNEKRFPDLPV